MTILYEILYPIFLKCCAFTNDIYWKGVFEDFAYGKTPIGVYIPIGKNAICCNIKNKEFNCRFDNDISPQDLFNEIHLFLTSKLFILSTTEQLVRKTNPFKCDSLNVSKWSDIKKKSLKDFLIESFVIDTKNNYNLNIQQAKYLLSVLFIAIVFKIISSSDIVLNNNKIVKINGLNIVHDKIIFNKNMYNTDEYTDFFYPEIIIGKKIFNDTWLKIKNK